MKKPLQLKQVLAALLTIVAVMVGHQAMAQGKTVTYTISYTGTNTLTATPDVAGFDGSTEVITGPAITGSNDNFGLFLHDNLNVIFNLYQSSGNRRMYVSDDGVTFTFAANITTCCSNYYIKHIAMKDHNGTAIMVYDLNAYPPTNLSFDLDVDLDKLGASGAPTTVTEHHVRTANNITTIKTITITYDYQPRSYNLTYNNAVSNGYNGVTNNNPSTYRVSTNTFQITAPTRTGYDFDGFTYTDAAHPTATAAELPMTISRGEAATRKAITFDASWTAHTYTLRLRHNDGSNDYIDMAMTYDVAANLQTVTRTGYTFANWSTNLDGTGTTYTEGQSVTNLTATNNAIVNLYAQWTANTYTLRLHHNDGSNDYTDMAMTYDVAANLQTITRTGYTFANWSTNPDGTGTTYTEGQSVSNLTDVNGAIVDLYAQWTANTYTLRLHHNDGSNDYTDMAMTYDVATNLQTITRTGYTFANWSTNPDGSGTTYTEGQSVSNLTNVNGAIVDLYAQWTANTYTVTLDNQSATTPGTATVTATYDAAMPAITVPTKTGYTFGGYYTETNGGGTQYYNADGSSAHNWDIASATTLYAQWTIITYSITYDLAGGSVASANPTTYTIHSPDITLNNPTRFGCTFAGWTGTDLTEPTMTVTIAQGSTGDRSYTATWTLLPVTYIDADGVEQTLYDYTLLEGSYGYIEYGDDDTEAWYVVAHDVTYNGIIYFKGSANLILEDGATLTLTAEGQSVPMDCNSNLTIYAQSGGTGAIVGDIMLKSGVISDGNMTIHGGQISIGSGYIRAEGGGNMTIHGGQISIESGYIEVSGGGDMTINGGEVSVTMTGYGNAIRGSHVVINGGNVTTTNPQGGKGICGSDVTINGGSVSATSTSYDSYSYGIYADGNVTINGGIVNATGSEYDIYGRNGITLGWTNLTDRITASIYYPFMTIWIKDGQTLWNGSEALSGTISDTDKLDGKTLEPCFSITYDLAGGSVATANPTTYTVGSSDITLNNPTRAGYTFAGWTGTDLDEPTMTVTIVQGSTGDRSYTATWSLPPVTYIDADGVAQTLYDYTLLEGSNEFIEYGEYNTEAWYVVAHDVTYNEGVRFYGSANLILMDGATLTVRRVSVGHNYLLCDTDLTIYVQSGGTGAIVGENIMLDSNGSMTIHGGQISVEKEGGNGIRASNNLTINGGVVSVTETANGTAIYSEHLVINGGVVTTTNQQGGSGIYGFYELTINGGVVTTTNQQGGYGIYGFYELTINGGNVTTTNQQGGYGIYGYYEVTINGGLVTANATEGAYGIGVEYSYRIITLGWTDETDRITSDSYYGTVTVATGQAFVDVAGNYYMNTLTDSQMAAMSGQTLIPFDDFDMPFAITYETNGGTLPSGYPATYTFAETVTLPTPTKEDNIFRGWYDNADFEDYPVTEITAGTALGAKTFYAYWAPKHTDVTYLDADGQPQTVRSTVLYENETYTGVYEGGVYTILDTDGYVYYDLLRFNGDATLILPDGGYLGAGGAGKGATDSEEYGLFVEGNLTIYGQEKGNGYIASVICEVDGNVNIYGGEVFLYNLTTNADSDINLSWTGLENYIIINPTQGNVHLLKDFVSYSYNEEWEQTFNTILHAGEPVSIADLCNHALYPYIETIDVSYIDENGDEHIAHDAQVLWGNETSLPGGTYTFINSRLQFDHEVTFDGNTTIIVPDDMSITMNNPDGNDITVNSDLAIYGQEERSGYFGSYSEDGIHATGDVTASNFYSATHKISSGGNLLIAGGTQHYTYLVANGTIILGYLAEGDAIQAHDYEGTVVIRAGQTMISYSFEDLYSGTLTPEQVAELGDRRLMPYLTPITLEVEGYGESTESDHWVFIATPIVGSLGPEFVTNLIDGMSPSGQSNFDLYRFNQSAELEWENFYQHLTGGNSFALENGKGYLYANKNDVTLEFNGVVYPAASKEVALDYDANARLAGWNLVGNPFHAPATLNKSYYKMNSDGTGLVAEAVSGNTAIDAFTGVMVQANGEDETVLFTKSNAKGQQETGFGTLQIALTQTGTRGNALLDNAIVSFNEGDQLGKFYFGTQDANIYIPQGNEEYAIVSAGNTGEIPVNFKAHENGEYTITVNPKNVEMGYLHLIDNLTGADVDLLQTPEYVFTAQTTD